MNYAKFSRVAGLPIAEVVETYNVCAKALGRNPVKKFENRTKADARTIAILQETPEAQRPAPFGPVDPVTGNVSPEPNGETDEGTEPNVSATQDADTPPAPPPAKAALVFGEREGTNRKRLIDCLVAKRGKFVPLVDIIRAVYPDAPVINDSAALAQFKGPVGMVMKGLNVMIEKNKLPVTLTKQKKDKVTSYGLIDK